MADEFHSGMLMARGIAWSSIDIYRQGCSDFPQDSKDRYSSSYRTRNPAFEKVTELSPLWEAPKNYTENKRLKILLRHNYSHTFILPALKYNKREKTAMIAV